MAGQYKGTSLIGGGEVRIVLTQSTVAPAPAMDIQCILPVNTKILFALITDDGLLAVQLEEFLI